MERLRRTEVGGLPVWWAPDPGPLRAALAFRVGMADEPLALHGVTHLAEHLSLFRLGRQAYAYNATVEDSDTIFDVKGERDEVFGFLRAAVDGLREPPLDRFADEVRVLDAEALTRGNSLSTRMRQWRYGARTYGIRGKRELGLRRLTPEALAEWTAARFTAGNAIMWLTGEPPADLDLGLPPGERIAMPADDPIPRLVLPAYLRDDEGVVAITFVADEPDAEAVRVTAAVARARLYDRLRRECALVYDVDQGHGVVGGGRLHVRVSIDCRDEDAQAVRDALLGTLEDLARTGPTAEELAFEADQTRRYLDDPAALEGRLADAALDELHGVRPLVDDELAAAIEALTPDACAAALARALANRLVLVPVALEAETPAGLHDYDVGSPEGPELEGREFRELDETECRRRPCRVVVAEDALHWRAGDGSGELLVRFDEVAALVREAGDSHVLIGIDDVTFDLSPLAFHDGDALRDALVAGVGEERVVPLDARAARVEERGAAELSRREMLTEELYRLSRDLTEDEEIVKLAEAEDNDGPGLLALTDRRLIWHYVARGAEGDEDVMRELPREDVEEPRADTIDGLGVLRFVVAGTDEKGVIEGIAPAEAAAEIARELGGRVVRQTWPEPAAAAEKRGRARELLRLRQR